MRRSIKSYIQLSSLLLMVFIFFGISVQAQSPPRLRIVHAAPGLQRIDIYLEGTAADNKILFDNIPYRFISDYIVVAPDPINIIGRPAGTNRKFGAIVQFADFTYEENKDYTLIITNRLEETQRVNWTLEDNNELPGTGTSRVRIVHAALDSPLAEVCLAYVCHTLAFQQDSEYFLMEPGTYFPRVRLDSTNKIHVNIPPLVLQDNGVHTIFLTGQLEGQPHLQLLYTFDAGELADTYPPPDHPHGGKPGGGYPPPVYPPVTGAFLSPKAMVVVVGAVLILASGIGFWLARN